MLHTFHMRQAIALALRGEGSVEPNPMVGCVVAHDADVVGLGWHGRFGGPHAEVEALRIAGERARGATMYVTLEPCCHQGKTPPCADAIIAAGVAEVVVAVQDPFPKVAGGGLAKLREAGISVTTGTCEAEALAVLAPYLMLTEQARPWVIAKWAMTLDGKIATRTGESRWISSAASRAVVHRLRGRVDGILVGRGTAEADDPQLMARAAEAGLISKNMPADDATSEEAPAWPPRVATRIILDRQARLSPAAQLVGTASAAPVLVGTGPDAPEARTKALAAAGCEILRLSASESSAQLAELLDELGRRRMTNLLVEGGSEILGAFHDAGLIDEVHAFLAPKLLGGKTAPGPIGGIGLAQMSEVLSVADATWRELDGDLYLRGRISRG